MDFPPVTVHVLTLNLCPLRFPNRRNILFFCVPCLSPSLRVISLKDEREDTIIRELLDFFVPDEKFSKIHQNTPEENN